MCGLRPDRRLDRRRRTRRPKVSLVRTTQVIWDPPPGTCGSALNAIKLHFIVGTAQLQDPAAAALVLRNVVAGLKANHRVATITRTTSSEGGPAISQHETADSGSVRKVAAWLVSWVVRRWS